MAAAATAKGCRSTNLAICRGCSQWFWSLGASEQRLSDVEEQVAQHIDCANKNYLCTVCTAMLRQPENIRLCTRHGSAAPHLFWWHVQYGELRMSPVEETAALKAASAHKQRWCHWCT